MTDNVIIIPTRLEATRLPNKPLKKINNKTPKLSKKDLLGETIKSLQKSNEIFKWKFF